MALTKCVQTHGNGSPGIRTDTGDTSCDDSIAQGCSRITYLIIALLLTAILPQPSYSAEQTNGCHCFRNRTFNPQDRFASDDYLLTTTFNSFLASEFNISKRQIILMKMREGIMNNDLIIGLHLSKESNIKISQLLEMKKKDPWQEIIRQLHSISTSANLDDLLHPADKIPSDDQLAEHITNNMITKRFNPDPEMLKLLRKNEIASREIILASTLAEYTGTQMTAIVNQHRKNKLSWSEIAHNFGLEPGNVGKLLESKKQ